MSDKTIDSKIRTRYREESKKDVFSPKSKASYKQTSTGGANINKEEI